MTHVLHINDNNLVVQTLSEQGGATVQRSRGYAWLKGDEVLFDLNSDDSPLQHCRLSPQQINTRYWQQCAQTAISSNGAGMRHAADLIWKHLAELKTASSLNDVALVVPANYRDSHLQLLLGVAKANDLDVSALIAKPVLAAKQHGLPQGQHVHIDVQLHQTVISNLVVTAENIALSSADVKTDVGLYSLQEALLHKLQENFIRADRFDPLHDADTEQQLFDQLPALVDSAIKGEKATIGVKSKGKLYSATVDSNEIASAFEGLIQLVSDYNNQSMVLDLNEGFDLTGLPALVQPKLIFAETPAAISARLASAKNADGNVIYQTTLTANAPAAQAAPTSAPRKVESASKLQKTTSKETPKRSSSPTAEPLLSSNIAVTHLLQMGVAVPINQVMISTNNATLLLGQSSNGSDVASLLTAGDLQIVNAPERKVLQPNDRLMSPLADGVITAVAVV